MSNNLDKYLSGGSYKANPIPRDKVGIFRVKGEVTAISEYGGYGGSHYQPELGIYRGKFDDVAAYAVELSGFFRGGSGGSIEEIKIKEITADDASKRRKLLEERKFLKKKLEEIEESLGECYWMSDQ